MFLPTGPPPGYQHAAWAAAGLQAPPTGTRANGAEQGLFYPHPGPTGTMSNGGASLTQADFVEAAVKTWKAEEQRMGTAANLLQQAMAKHDTLNDALQQSATTHAMAQQAITVMHGFCTDHNRMSATIEQLTKRIDNLEATLATVLRHQAGLEPREAPPWFAHAKCSGHADPPAEPRAHHPGEDDEQEDGPLMKRFRAITWKDHAK